MKYLFGIIIIFSFFSCKKVETNNTKEYVVELDTVFCNYSKEPIIKNKSISLYNKPYNSIIKTYSLLNDKIVKSSEKKIELCYHKEADIFFIQNVDTIFNIKINAPFLTKKYKSFYTNYIESMSTNQDSINLSITKPIEHLKLDSVTLSGARTKYVYFTCYGTNYESDKSYKVDIGVNYVENNVDDFLINQLEEIK